MILGPMLGEKRPAGGETVQLSQALYDESTLTASAGRHAEDIRAWVRPVVFIVLVVLVASVGWWVRWSSPATRAYPDTFWYARSALQYAGTTDPVANREAARLTCDGMLTVGHPYNTSSPADCRSYRERLPDTVPPRWQRIFTTRPGYPVLAAPLVRFFGPPGFLIATALLSIACGMAMAGLALASGLRRAQALAAVVLFYALPSGYWATRLLSEVPMLLFLCLALTGAVLLLRVRRQMAPGVTGGGSQGPTSLHCGLVALGLLGLLAVKSANGVAVTAALLIAAVAAVSIPSLRRSAHSGAYGVQRGAVLLAALAVVVLGVHAATNAMFHLPGLSETMQDTFTGHFRRPDVPDPWARLTDMALHMWSAEVLPQLTPNHGRPTVALPIVSYLVLLLALGLAGVALTFNRNIAILLLLVISSGPAVATIHPLVSEFDRLTVVVWVPVALGLAALIPRRLQGLFGDKR